MVRGRILARVRIHSLHSMSRSVTLSPNSVFPSPSHLDWSEVRDGSAHSSHRSSATTLLRPGVPAAKSSGVWPSPPLLPPPSPTRAFTSAPWAARSRMMSSTTLPSAWPVTATWRGAVKGWRIEDGGGGWRGATGIRGSRSRLTGSVMCLCVTDEQHGRGPQHEWSSPSFLLFSPFSLLCLAPMPSALVMFGFA